MCHLYMRLSDTFDQNHPCTFDKIRETHSDEKRSYILTLRAKVQVKAKINQGSRKQKTCLPKNLSRGSLSNWCDADGDEDTNADISKTICQPPPYRGST